MGYICLYVSFYTVKEVIFTMCSFLRSIHIGLFLCFGNIFLVPDPFVSIKICVFIMKQKSLFLPKPVGHLRNSNLALTCQLLLHLFARIRIAEVWIEIFIEYLRGLFTEVASFPSVMDLYLIKIKFIFNFSYRASKNLDLSTMTFSHVDCFSCTWIPENFFWIIDTIRSISLDAIGRVRAENYIILER